MNIKLEVLIEVINYICSKEHHRSDFFPIVSADQRLSEMNIDSLEYMMLYMWLGDIYGIDGDLFEEAEVEGDVTLGRIHKFVEDYATKDTSLESAIKCYRGV